MLRPCTQSLSQFFKQPMRRAQKLALPALQTIVPSVWMISSTEILVQHVSVCDQVLFDVRRMR